MSSITPFISDAKVLMVKYQRGGEYPIGTGLISTLEHYFGLKVTHLIYSISPTYETIIYSHITGGNHHNIPNQGVGYIRVVGVVDYNIHIDRSISPIVDIEHIQPNSRYTNNVSTRSRITPLTTSSTSNYTSRLPMLTGRTNSYIAPRTTRPVRPPSSYVRSTVQPVTATTDNNVDRDPATNLDTIMEETLNNIMNSLLGNGSTMFNLYANFLPERQNQARDRSWVNNIEIIRYNTLNFDDRELPEMCSICRDEFQSDSQIVNIPRCQHVFHHRCLISHIDGTIITRDPTCPMCRCNLRTVYTSNNNGEISENDSEGEDDF